MLLHPYTGERKGEKQRTGTMSGKILKKCTKFSTLFFLLWEIELLAYLLSSLHLYVLWVFCKEHKHACAHTNTHTIPVLPFGRKGRKDEKEGEKGRKEERKNGRERWRIWWGKLAHRSLKCHLASLAVSLILLNTRVPCPFLLMTLPCHCHWLFHTPSLWDCPFLVADKTKALRIKTCKATNLTVVQPEAGDTHQLDHSPSNARFPGTLFCSVCGQVAFQFGNTPVSQKPILSLYWRSSHHELGQIRTGWRKRRLGCRQPLIWKSCPEVHSLFKIRRAFVI